jgi:hypothetical protein
LFGAIGRTAVRQKFLRNKIVFFAFLIDGDDGTRLGKRAIAAALAHREHAPAAPAASEQYQA